MEPTVGTVSIGTWNRLGTRTYWLFLFEKLEAAGGFLILAIVFSIIRGISGLPRQIVPMLGLAGVVSFIICFVALGIAALMAWVLYRSHEFCLADDALKIRQGIITKQEIAIPYRQIQNVDIERTIGERFFGLSKIIVLTAGHEDRVEKHQESDQAEGILPAMDQYLAAALQTELIHRADVQKVIETK